MNELEKFNGKRILIWGYGREGKSTENFLKNHCHCESIEIFEGKREEIEEARFDFIFKSPGIVMEEENPKYTSETELFLSLFKKQVIGITGTKGKSTTSAMMTHVLGCCLQQPVLLMGNIGRPCLDYYDDMQEDTVVVFELSCHQLAHGKVSPHIALFLNLFEEHLDYYGTVEKYFAAKKHITAYQEEGDILLIGEEVPAVSTKAKKVVITEEIQRHFPLQILGEHNQYNAKFVYTVAKDIFHCEEQAVVESLESFTGLAHRLQFVGKKNGIDFYDDSISTIPEATIQAIESIQNTQTVIVGGMDRNIDYSKLITYMREHQQYHYLCCYASGERIYKEVSDLTCCELLKDIKEAVQRAKEITDAGKACVLSPAAASYGYFKNFEERGEYFQTEIL